MNIKTVLLVDDDASIRRIAQLVLSKLTQWEIIQAESGEAAIELMQTEFPDVILMDVMMPKMDGITCFLRLKENELFDKPVIFMTAKVQSQEIAIYTEMGAAGVIMKPFAPSDLPEQILAIISNWYSKKNKTPISDKAMAQ